MEGDLQSDYDVIVIGTGMPECILAAAAARIGKTVLHLDRNEYYGGNWASFNFDQIQNWIKCHKEVSTSQAINEETQEVISEDESCIYLNRPISSISNVCEISCVRNDETSDDLPSSSTVENSVEEQHAATSNNAIQAQELDLNTESSSSNQTAPISQSDNVNVNSEEQINETDTEHTEHTDNVVSSESPAGSIESEAKDGCSRDSASCSKKNELKKEWTISSLKNQYRKFNLDLSPKLLFSRGSLIELLISSNIARYAEFKSFTRILTLLDGGLKQVPCSRADVFSTKDVGVVEKRMLMQFLQFCLEYQKNPTEYKGFEGRPFIDFLRSRKLTSRVEYYILHSIAMVDESTPTLQGLKATQTFLESLGRYGNSPFLWSLYGSAELPQCFCRLCAVFGGIYHLKRTAEALILNNEGSCKGIITNRQRINCSWVVMESCYAMSVKSSNNSSLSSLLPDNFNPGKVSRAIFITDSSILPSEREQITLLRIPKGNGTDTTVTVMELGPGAYVCPSQTYVVHFTCQSVAETAKEDLLSVAELILQPINNENMAEASTKPKVLWCVFFNQTDTTVTDLHISYPKCLFLTSSPGVHLDYEYAVQEAKELFQVMFPDEEFLPRAPDPEEISLEPFNNPGENESPAVENIETPAENDESNVNEK